MKPTENRAEQYIMECVENYKREDIPYTQAIVAINIAKKEFEEQLKQSNNNAIRAYSTNCRTYTTL